jgi:outer membrane immunogenic protein
MRRSGLVALVVSGAAALAASSAHAADMAAPSYYPPAAVLTLPPAHYDWTGFYLGGNVGAGLLDDLVSQAPGTPVTALTGSTRVNPVGLIGGAQAGINYEFAPVVIGAEVSWSASNISGSATVPTAAGAFERATDNPQWLGAVTGRIGYAANDVLVYVKGGGARMNVNYTQDILVGGALAGPTQSIGDTRNGYTAGVGIEYGLTENWSARLEYDYYGFGTRTYGFAQTPVTIQSQLQTLTFGINYRFTWAGGSLFH